MSELHYNSPTPSASAYAIDPVFCKSAPPRPNITDMNPLTNIPIAGHNEAVPVVELARWSYTSWWLATKRLAYHDIAAVCVGAAAKKLEKLENTNVGWDVVIKQLGKR
jgi:hypothetical protein